MLAFAFLLNAPLGALKLFIFLMEQCQWRLHLSLTILFIHVPSSQTFYLPLYRKNKSATCLQPTHQSSSCLEYEKKNRGYTHDQWSFTQSGCASLWVWDNAWCHNVQVNACVVLLRTVSPIYKSSSPSGDVNSGSSRWIRRSRNLWHHGWRVELHQLWQQCIKPEWFICHDALHEDVVSRCQSPNDKIFPLPSLHCQFPLNLRVELVVPLQLQSTIGLDLQAEAGLVLPSDLCRRHAADIFTSDAEWALDFHYAVRRLHPRIMDKAISRCTKKAHGVMQGQTTWLNSQPSVTDAVHVWPVSATSMILMSLAMFSCSWAAKDLVRHQPLDQVVRWCWVLSNQDVMEAGTCNSSTVKSYPQITRALLLGDVFFMLDQSLRASLGFLHDLCRSPWRCHSSEPSHPAKSMGLLWLVPPAFWLARPE